MSFCCAICKEFEQQTTLGGKCNLTNKFISDSTNPKESCSLGKPIDFVDSTGIMTKIQVGLIDNSDFIMRKVDEHIVSELVLNIKEHGLLQPIMVRETESNRFEIIFGRHRLEACRRLGYRSISAIIKTCSEEEAIFLQIIENIQRNNKQGILKQGMFYATLQKKGLSTRQIGKRIGKSGVYVQDCISVAVKLHPKLRPLVEQLKINRSMAHRIAELPRNKQVEITKRAINEKWRIKDFELHCRGNRIVECHCLTCPKHGHILKNRKKKPPLGEVYFAGTWIRRRSNKEEEQCAFCGKTFTSGDYTFPLKYNGNLTSLQSCEDCAIPRLPEDFVRLFEHFRVVDPYMRLTTKVLIHT